MINVLLYYLFNLSKLRSPHYHNTSNVWVIQMYEVLCFFKNTFDSCNFQQYPFGTLLTATTQARQSSQIFCLYTFIKHKVLNLWFRKMSTGCEIPLYTVIAFNTTKTCYVVKTSACGRPILNLNFFSNYLQY